MPNNNPSTKHMNLKDNLLWCWLGRACYYLGWPAIWLIIRMSPRRARVLVVVDNKLLLVKDWLGPNRWSIPGGGLHRDEDARFGALRELDEEVGLLLGINQLQELGEIRVVNNLITTDLVIFKAELKKTPQVYLSGLEVLDYCWVSLGKIQNIKVDSSTKRVLETFSKSTSLLH